MSHVLPLGRYTHAWASIDTCVPISCKCLHQQCLHAFPTNLTSPEPESISVPLTSVGSPLWQRQRPRLWLGKGVRDACRRVHT
jgi:hypothetical protein